MQQPNSVLWDIATALDDIGAQFHQVQNMLVLYDEQIEADITFLNEHKESGAGYFIDRYDLLRSLMEITQFYIVDIHKSLKQQADVAYEAYRATNGLSE